MDLEWLHTFLHIVRHKSLSKASEYLNMTQPAISKQIRKLEEAVGVTLFHRSAHGMELTHAGTKLQDRIVPWLAELDGILADIRPVPDIHHVVLGTIPSLASTYLSQRIMTARQKGIDVRVVVQPRTPELLEMLNDGRIDIAIVERTPVHKSVWAKDLFDEPVFVVVPDRHPLANRGHVSLEEVKDEAFVVHPPECAIRRHITELFRERGYTLQIADEVAYSDFILAFVEAGAGITIVPRSTALHAEHMHLKLIELADVDYHRTVTLLAKDPAVGRLLAREFGPETPFDIPKAVHV